MNLFSLAAGNWFVELLNTLWAMICEAIYIFIGALYQVYEKVASINLFSTEVFETITGRLYVVMGIAMLFIFAYNIILMIINPDDKKSSGQMGKIVKETMISLAIIVLLPTIFNYLYIFQSHVLESNIISQIILGPVGSTDGDSTNCDATDYDCSCDFSDYGLEEYNNEKYWFQFWKQGTTDKTDALKTACQKYKTDLSPSQRGAYSIAPTLYSAFFRPTNFDFSECVTHLQGGNSSIESDSEDHKICVNYFYDITASKYTGNIRPFVNDSFLRDIVADSSKTSMEFHWIMAIVAGGLAVYMFICYTMEVGVRVAKLGFLQLISPIPVMMRIVPGQKDKVYKKWFDNLLNSYLDVFIRIFIIDFALFAISLVPDVISTMWRSMTSGSENFFIKALATAIVILGILKFAQDAPKLLKELFDFKGTLALKSPGKQLSENKVLMGGVNAFRGGIYGATTGENAKDRIGGFFSGAARGAVSGYDKAVQGLDTARVERANGSTFGGRMIDRARRAIGMETRADSGDRSIETVFHSEERRKANEELMKKLDAINKTIESKIDKESSKINIDVVDNAGNKILSGTWSNIKKYQNALAAQISNASTDAERQKAFQKYKEFESYAGKARKKTQEELLNNLLHKDSSGASAPIIDYNGVAEVFSKADANAVLANIESLNSEIAKGIVGTRYSDDGTEISGSTRSANNSIDNNSDLKDLKDLLEEQAAEIQRHSIARVDEKYMARQADSRMVKRNGKSEKK